MNWQDLQNKLSEHAYIANQELAMALKIALQLERPILLEGEAGVGKTQAAKTPVSYTHLTLPTIE